MKLNVNSYCLEQFKNVGLTLSIVVALTGCNNSTSSQPKATPASTAAITAVASTQLPQATINQGSNSVVLVDEPLTQLVATTLNNGFLLAVNKQPKLTSEQKKCLSDFDSKQTLELATSLLQNNLNQTQVKEANDFYTLPVGQKIIKFNQSYFNQLKQGKTQAGELDVTNDEKLQISAFIQTQTGQKIQQIASHNLPQAVAPLEIQQLQRCNVSSEVFNAVEPTASTTAHSVAKP